MGIKFELFGRLKKHPSHHYPPKKVLEAYTPSIQGEKPEPAKDIAKRMLKLGKSEEEIRMVLKSRGFTFQEIEDAIKQALKEQIEEGAKTKTRPAFQDIQKMQNLRNKIGGVGVQTQHSLKEVSVDENDEDVLLEELEEIVDMILEVKYGKLTSLPQEFQQLKEEVKNLIRKEEDKESQDILEIKEKLESFEEEIKDIKSTLEDLVPRLNALENAFRDTIPNIIDDLRKIEEEIEGEKVGGERDVKVYALNKHHKGEEERDKESEREEKDKEETPFKLDDLIS